MSALYLQMPHRFHSVLPGTVSHVPGGRADLDELRLIVTTKAAPLWQLSLGFTHHCLFLKVKELQLEPSEPCPCQKRTKGGKLRWKWQGRGQPGGAPASQILQLTTGTVQAGGGGTARTSATLKGVRCTGGAARTSNTCCATNAHPNLHAKKLKCRIF